MPLLPVQGALLLQFIDLDREGMVTLELWSFSHFSYGVFLNRFTCLREDYITSMERSLVLQDEVS